MLPAMQLSPPMKKPADGTWSAPDPVGAWRRAAWWTWAAAGALLLVFLPCAGVHAIIGLLPEAPFEELLDGMREANGAALPEGAGRQSLWLSAGAVVAVLLGGPAVVLGVMGWKVHQRRAAWVRPTAGLLLATSGLVGVLLLMALLQGNPASAVLGLVLLGAPLAMCLLAVRALWRAAHEEHLAPPEAVEGGGEVRSTGREPWDGW